MSAFSVPDFRGGNVKFPQVHLLFKKKIALLCLLPSPASTHSQHQTMPLAVVATDIGDWRRVLQVQEVDNLSASQGLLKVKVAAAGLCFPDVLTIEGKHVMKKAAPFTPGNEIAGRIVDICQEDADETGFKAGDIVFGTCVSGGMAEYALMPVSNAYLVPGGVDPGLVAGFEVNYGTAYHGLVDIAKLKKGDTVLVLGASGGVGLAAVDLCKAVRFSAFTFDLFCSPLLCSTRERTD